MPPRAAIVLLVPLLIAADTARNDLVGNDHELIQGPWKAVKGWRHGNPVAQDEVDRLRLEFAGGKMVVKENNRGMEGRFVLHPQHSPSHIDFELKEMAMKFEGVYQVDGDRLRLAFTRDGGARPTGFDTKAAGELVLLELRRDGK